MIYAFLPIVYLVQQLLAAGFHALLVVIFQAAFFVGIFDVECDIVIEMSERIYNWLVSLLYSGDRAFVVIRIEVADRIERFLYLGLRTSVYSQ
jgi:hypothetical protein